MILLFKVEVVQVPDSTHEITWPRQWPTQDTEGLLPLTQLAGEKTEMRNSRLDDNGILKPVKDEDYKIAGIDTETCNGKVRMVSWEYEKFGKSHSGTFDVDSFFDVVLGLLRLGWTDKKYARWFAKDFFFYNLKYDHDAILKTLLLDDSDLMERIVKAGFDGVYFDAKTLEIKDKDTKNEGHCVKVTCVYKKKFSIHATGVGWEKETYIMYRSSGGKNPKQYFEHSFGKKKMSPINMWDISQFYGGGLAANAHLVNEKKIDFEPDLNKYPEGWNSEAFWTENLDDIRDYAVQDAVIAGKLARLKSKSFREQKVRFSNPYSKAKIAEQTATDMGYDERVRPLRNTMIGTKFLEMGVTAFNGGRFETSGVGFSDDVIAIDLNSAYPHIMTTIPSLATKKGAKATEINGLLEFGYGKQGWDDYLSMRKGLGYTDLAFVEAIFVFKEGQEWYPLSDFDVDVQGLVSPQIINKIMTVQEYVEACKWPMEIEPVVQRWCFHLPADSQSKPWKGIIEHWWGEKDKAAKAGKKGTDEYAVPKLMMNSLYGKLIQGQKEGFDRQGNIYNPAFAAAVTGSVRAELARCARYAMRDGGQVLAMATDGIFIKNLPKSWKPPTQRLPGIGKLGEWEQDGEGQLLVMGNGIMSFGPMLDPNAPLAETKSTTRGETSYNGLATVGKKTPKGWQCNWLDFCKKHSLKSELPVKGKAKPLGIKAAINRNIVEQTNQFIEGDGTMKPVQNSKKRLLTTKPKTFGDLLNNWYPSTAPPIVTK